MFTQVLGEFTTLELVEPIPEQGQALLLCGTGIAGFALIGIKKMLKIIKKSLKSKNGWAILDSAFFISSLKLSRCYL